MSPDLAAANLPFDASRQSPTVVRHVVVLVTASMSLLLYLDRFCISFAEIYIKEDLRLSDTQIGWMLSAFFWTYALGQVFAGWLTDKFGARLTLTVFILLWSLFTGLTGLAFGFALLLFLRFGFGLAQAGAYPTSASLISKWVPFSNRGTASSMIAVGGRIGGALAPILTAYLIVLCVPLSVSSRLESSDLRSAPRLSYELLYGRNTAKPADQEPTVDAAKRSGARIIERLPTATQQVIAAQATRYAAALDEVRTEAERAGKKTDRLAASVAPPAPDDLASLAAGMNEVLAQSDLFLADDVKDFSKSTEAKRLLRLDPEHRSATENERLNRLLLETVFPESVKKVYGHGWRSVMFFYGAIGMLVAGAFWLVFRNRPAAHPFCNAAEVNLIESGRPATTARTEGAVGGVPIMAILSSPSMWLNCLSQFTTNIGWVFLVTWLPRYLENVHRLPLEQRAWMVFIPSMVGWFGMLLGGKLTDRLVSIVGLRWGRALPMALSKFVAMAAYLACLFEPSPWFAVAAFSLVAFSTDLGIGGVWAFTQDVGGRYTGSVLGWGNMWGNFGAAITPPLLIWIAGENQNWTAVFITCAVAFFISGAAALGINATIPIVHKEKLSPTV